jgi:hypothetical protein
VYRLAYTCSDEKIVYYDSVGNKYIAFGGNLAWRINNPGLVHSHSHFSGSRGSIGSCGPYSIFSTPQQGRQALVEWLRSKKYYDSPLKTLAEHYQPNNPEIFLQKLSSIAMVPPDVKLKNLNNKEFDHLLLVIEKLCGYTKVGNETFSLLPKIIARIENGKNLEDTYLVGDRVVLSKQEAIEYLLSI